jgi:CoA:oxalate CoA-transferase
MTQAADSSTSTPVPRSRATSPRQTMLSGLRIVETANWISGPLAGRMLADLGAEVIKIEQPPRGDGMRAYGRKVDGVGVHSFNVNHGKSSVMLDLTSEEGKADFLRLIASSDVLLENWRIGAADRLGLTDAVLEQANPRLVRLVISGFGPVGPRSTQPVYDQLIQAWSGLAHANGRGSTPAFVLSPIIDKETAAFSAIAILAALRSRDRDGVGSRIDVSMLDVSAFMNFPDMLDVHTFLDDGAAQASSPIRLRTEVLRTADGHLTVAPASGAQLKRCLEAVGHPEWLDELRSKTSAAESENAFHDLMESALIHRPTSHWLGIFGDADVPTAPLLSFEEHLVDPQVEVSETYEEIETEYGRVRRVRFPIRVDGQRLPPTTISPAPGSTSLATVLSSKPSSPLLAPDIKV